MERQVEASVVTPASVWPRISIITPSFNQAGFLERTLCSVLDQNYPNLEYIVIDGGSTDGSVEIIKKYEDRLAYWVSEPDGGQSQALNKGFERATGEVIGWLNSDDLYHSGTLLHVGEWFAEHPQHNVFYGGLSLIDSQDCVHDAVWAGTNDPRYTFWVGLDVHQQSLFWRRELMDQIGMIDETMRFSMDLDFIVRLLLHGRAGRTRRYLGMFRLHEDAKTATMVEQSWYENRIIRDRYCHQLPLPKMSAALSKLWLRTQRVGKVLFDAPPLYFAFKLGRRIGLTPPVSWLGSELSGR